MSKLSVIVPVYNSEKYLEECIESICNQIWKDIQIILVDDGSSDNSGNICDAYSRQDRRIKTIHQSNLGPAVARYQGILASDSEYVTFVDSDDWVDTNAYSIFVEEMKKGIDLIIFGKIDEKRNVGRTYPKSIYPYGEYSKEDIEKTIWPSFMWDFKTGRPGMTGSLCDKIFKRTIILKSYELFEKVPNIHWGEDQMILFPILQWVNCLYISNECPYHYRLHLNKVSSYNSNDDFFDKLYVWYKHVADNTRCIPGINKQLEYFYMDALKSRKKFYGDNICNDEYFFPFKTIPAGSEIVLYGAGEQGMTYYDQIMRSNYCNIVVWVDKNYSLYKKYDVKTVEVLEDKNLRYDYIVIAISSDEIKKEVKEYLCTLGIETRKIV